MLSPSTHDWLRAVLDWLKRTAAGLARALGGLRSGPFRLPQSPNEAFIEANREAAGESFHAAGASKLVAELVMQAGYTGPDAFARAGWTAEESGGRYESAEWRIGMQHGCTPAALEEVKLFHDRLVAAAQRKREARGPRYG